MWPIIVTTPLEFIACWLYQHWVNDDGVGSTAKHGESFNLLWPFYEHMSWQMWPPIRLQNLLLSFCGKAMSQSLEHCPPSSWVTEVPTFESNHHQRACAHLWAYRKVRTLPYHAQTNGQVEWAHQTLIAYVKEMSKHWKADWPKHLPELVHAYNSTRYQPSTDIAHII